MHGVFMIVGMYINIHITDLHMCECMYVYVYILYECLYLGMYTVDI